MRCVESDWKWKRKIEPVFREQSIGIRAPYDYRYMRLNSDCESESFFLSPFLIWFTPASIVIAVIIV